MKNYPRGTFLIYQILSQPIFRPFPLTNRNSFAMSTLLMRMTHANEDLQRGLQFVLLVLQLYTSQKVKRKPPWAPLKRNSTLLLVPLKLSNTFGPYSANLVFHNINLHEFMRIMLPPLKLLTLGSLPNVPITLMLRALPFRIGRNRAFLQWLTFLVSLTHLMDLPSPLAGYYTLDMHVD